MVIKRLSEIQKKLKAPKNQYNSFGKYHYRSCEDILEAVKPLLGDAVVLISDEVVNIGERYYVKSTITIKDEEDEISVTAFAREELEQKGMSSAQITGSASSYARKYSANGLFLIDDTKDADHADNSKPVGKEKEPDVPQSVEDKPRPVTPAQKKVLAGLMEKEGMPVETQREFFNYVAPKDYEAAQTFIETFSSYCKTFETHKKGELL